MTGRRLGHGQIYPLATCTARDEFFLDALSPSAHHGTDPFLHTLISSLFRQNTAAFFVFFPAVIKNICRRVGSMHSTAHPTFCTAACTTHSEQAAMGNSFNELGSVTRRRRTDEDCT